MTWKTKHHVAHTANISCTGPMTQAIIKSNIERHPRRNVLFYSDRSVVLYASNLILEVCLLLLLSFFFIALTQPGLLSDQMKPYINTWKYWMLKKETQ
jgi:hypothetical protein